MFNLCTALSEIERELIREQVQAGIDEQKLKNQLVADLSHLQMKKEISYKSKSQW